MSGGPQINLLMISTSYPRDREDWRGRFIADMAAAVARLPDTRLSLWCPPGKMPEGVRYAATDAESKWLSALSRRGGISHLLTNHPMRGVLSAAGLLARLHFVFRRIKEPDLYHLNWIQNALALTRNRKPALVTVLGKDFALLRHPVIRYALRRVLRRRRCVIAPNADWMVADLHRWFGDIARVTPVPFGVDARWFEVARDPPATPQWLVISRLTRRKLGPLFEWGKGIFGENRRLNLFGPRQEEVDVPDWVLYHGPTHPDALRGGWFPHATGLLTLSEHDEGRPQVLLEAMASSLPVIASDLPAHRDILDGNTGGRLVRARPDLQHALESLEDRATNLTAGHSARARIRDRVGTWPDCAARYHRLYRDLLEPTL